MLMQLFDQIERRSIERRSITEKSIERRSITEKSWLDNPKEWLMEMFGGRSSVTGVNVTATTALQFGAVYACVRILAETVGSLPLPVYQRKPDGAKDKAPTHPLYRVIHDQPNPEQTAMEWREMQQGHLALRGNAYSQIVRDGSGNVVELWPLHPDRVRVRRAQTGELVYTITPTPGSALQPPVGPVSTQQQVLPAEEVLHLRGLSSDGVMGISPIQVASEVIGLGLAQQEYNARFFSNNASPNGILKFPGNLNPEKRKDLQKVVDEQTRTLGKAHRFLLLEGGLEWTQVGLSMRDAQFIQGAQLSVRDVARIFRVPPHKIGDLEQATFSNIEQQAIEFVTDAIRPWAVRWEQALTSRLLTERERRQGFFVKMNLEGLLRGDLESRYKAYAIGRNWGWLSADDVRDLEDMNHLPEKQGAIYLMPTNMTPADDDSPAPAPRPSPKKRPSSTEPDDDGDGNARRLRALAEDAIARTVKRELEDVRKLAKKHGGNAGAWRQSIEEFYTRHAAYVSEALRVELDAARGYANAHRAQLLADGMAAVEQWDTQAADELRELLGLEVTA